MPGIDTGVTGTLTDGSGIGSFTVPKVFKDLIVDALLTIPASLVAIQVLSLEAAVVAPLAVGFAVGDSLIRVVYRALLKWGQT